MSTSASEDSGTDGEEATQPLHIDVTADDPDLRWLEAITTLLAHRSQETDPSPRVQFAMDMMVIAAAERVTRLLNNDVVDVQ
jgi:hypothetical protein